MAEDRFNHTPGEDKDQFFKTYETTVIDFKLDNLLTLQLLHKLFDEEFKKFYRDQLFENFLIYDDPQTKMIDQYIIAKPQNYMRQFLQNLNFK